MSIFGAQTKEPSAINAPSSSEALTDNIKVELSIDEPEEKEAMFATIRDTTSSDVETDRRFNELRHELLDNRAKMLDWWLATTAIFLTFLAIIIPIVALFGAFLSFKKFNEIKREAHRDVEDIQKIRGEADSHLSHIKGLVGVFASLDLSLGKEINAEVAHKDPGAASEEVKSVQKNPKASLIERAVGAALSLQKQGEIGQAIEKWRAVAYTMEERDNDLAARAWYSVGFLYSRKNEPEDINAAINAYDKALSLKPDYAEAYNNRGWEQINLGRFDKAISDFNEALRLKLDFPEAYNNRGFVQINLGRFDKAISDFNEALRLKPDYATAYHNLGLAERQLNRIDNARQSFKEALKLSKETNNTGLMKKARRELDNLDRNDT